MSGFDELGPIPRGGDGAPVFAAPWEAKVFALAVLAHERGVFGWGAFSGALAEECARGGAYYEAWARALERLLGAVGVAGTGEVAALAETWERAAEATPHGEPIRLENARVAG